MKVGSIQIDQVVEFPVRMLSARISRTVVGLVSDSITVDLSMIALGLVSSKLLNAWVLNSPFGTGIIAASSRDGLDL